MSHTLSAAKRVTDCGICERDSEGRMGEEENYGDLIFIRLWPTSVLSPYSVYKKWKLNSHFVPLKFLLKANLNMMKMKILWKIDEQ